MVAEIGVHDDDKVARRELQPVDVRGPESQFAGSRAQLDAVGVDFLQLLRNVLRAIGRGIVDYYDFPVEFTIGLGLAGQDYNGGARCDELFREGVV
jgi:hypothetical protein